LFVEGDATSAYTHPSPWVKPKIASFDTAAKGFVVYLSVEGIKGEPVVVVAEKIPQGAKQSARLPVKNVVGARRYWPRIGEAGGFPTVGVSILARVGGETETVELERAHRLPVQIEGALEHMPPFH
jgi:hypothetical protein